MINNNKGSKDKHHPQKRTIFACHTLNTWAKKLLSFEEREEKQGESIVTIALQVGYSTFV